MEFSTLCLNRTPRVLFNLANVGETDRVLRGRQYEHRTIDHKTASRSASIQEEPENEVRQEEQTGLRRSERNKGKKKRDYKAENTGSNQLLTEGGTEFSAHVASDIHEKSDLEFTVLCKDDDWFSRGVNVEQNIYGRNYFIHSYINQLVN